MTMLTHVAADPTGLGRVVRGADGSVRAIVEERDADAATRALREINPGIYAFDGGVWELLEGLWTGNAAGEYYLTDVVAAYLAAGLPVRAVSGASDPTVPVGVNDRAQLAHAERILRERVPPTLARGGGHDARPRSTYVDRAVELSDPTWCSRSASCYAARGSASGRGSAPTPSSSDVRGADTRAPS
jgi:bifunctional UDP-N-acetylglucosamine pyrophosphorylase / glucosamine-1-phosphate N-acetyltransferase